MKLFHRCLTVTCFLLAFTTGTGWPASPSARPSPATDDQREALRGFVSKSHTYLRDVGSCYDRPGLPGMKILEQVDLPTPGQRIGIRSVRVEGTTPWYEVITREGSQAWCLNVRVHELRSVGALSPPTPATQAMLEHWLTGKQGFDFGQLRSTFAKNHPESTCWAAPEEPFSYSDGEQELDTQIRCGSCRSPDGNLVYRFYTLGGKASPCTLEEVLVITSKAVITAETLDRKLGHSPTKIPTSEYRIAACSGPEEVRSWKTPKGATVFMPSFSMNENYLIAFASAQRVKHEIQYNQSNAWGNLCAGE